MAGATSAGEEPAEPPTGEMLPMDPEVSLSPFVLSPSHAPISTPFQHQALMHGTKIYVPAIAAKLAKLEGEMASDTEFDLDDTDHELMEFEPGKESSNVEPSASSSQAQQRKKTAADEPPYEPCAAEVLKHVTLIPPPTRVSSAQGLAFCEALIAILTCHLVVGGSRLTLWR